MRMRMPVTHDHFGGKLHLYKRENSPYWQCSTFLASRNHRTTTKERDLDHAKKKAEEWYLSLQLQHRTGELKGGRTFAAAAAKFVPEYEALMAGERSPRYIKQHSDRLRVHLLPFFGDKRVADITPQLVQDYRVHRMTSRKNAKGEIMRPSRSVIHHEIVTLRHVLKTAQRLEWIKFIPNLSPPYKSSGKISHRAWFSPEEYKQLYTATRKRAAEALNPRWKWESEQLHDLVLFMVNTGLRPDEAARLEFRDVKIVHDKATGETILEIDVRGKRGTGFCKSMPGAVEPFRRLSERKRRAPTEELPLREAMPGPNDRLFPSMHRELFNAVLKDLGMKTDREGLRRSAYSLRHTYICLRLMEGADIYAIAKNCRTSVEMIEKFYASHIKERIDTVAVNVRRDRSNDRPQKRGADAKRLAAGKSKGSPQRRR